MFHKYKNGNTTVIISDEDGTRMMTTEDDDFDLEFPVNIDMMISSYCEYGCPMCYAGCSADGKHASFNWKFLNTLHPYTELAININSEAHPLLDEFLRWMKEKNIFVNVTVNQKYLTKHYEYLKAMQNNKLINGIGVSLSNPTYELIELIHGLDNVVIHAINGIFSERDYDVLKHSDLKILFLGYKSKGRGIEYEKDNAELLKNQKWLKDNLVSMKDAFSVLSFDCLGVEQLNAKRLVSEEEYETFYQGEDGTSTMAIDLVKGTYSKSSTDTREYPITDNIKEMFTHVRTL